MLACRARKASSSFASPIVAGGNAYFVNRVGVLYCADAENGKERWAERAGRSVWATPLAAGNRVYLFGRDGTTTVIRAGKEFEVLARNVLFESDGATEDTGTSGAEALPTPGASVLYAAAVAGKRIIIRTGDRVYCVAE